MLSRFDRIPERDGQTDGQTDRIAISISRVKPPRVDDRLDLVRPYMGWVGLGWVLIIGPRPTAGELGPAIVHYRSEVVGIDSLEGDTI